MIEAPSDSPEDLDSTVESADTSEQDVLPQSLGEPILVLISHPEQRLLGTRYRVRPQSELTIGRSPDCTIDFPDVSSVSRVHARILYKEDAVVIADLDSTNGTFVNHRRVREPVALASGDRLQLGGIHFKFLREADVEAAYFEALHQVALQDGLTELANKRRFDEELEREVARALRYRRKLSLILFDVDDFKRINDEHGHLYGDYVLQRIAEVARRQMRREEILARVGGDEFGILNPEVGLEGAATVAERLRTTIAGSVFETDFVRYPPRVTCSFGVAQLTENTSTADHLFNAADRALYGSKRSGRNRITVDAGSTNP
jgi:diguanylate cyclase (GGDEF)-like protein